MPAGVVFNMGMKRILAALLLLTLAAPAWRQDFEKGMRAYLFTIVTVFGLSAWAQEQHARGRVTVAELRGAGSEEGCQGAGVSPPRALVETPPRGLGERARCPEARSTGVGKPSQRDCSSRIPLLTGSWYLDWLGSETRRTT